MNYRHAFHAGNFADVVKHAVLCRILSYLREKPAAFRVIDSHAGAGLYDLAGAEAGKTLEWQGGIGRLLKAEIAPDVRALLAPYLDAVAGFNANDRLKTYPGSPALVQALLRRQDRLIACELEPRTANALERTLHGDNRAKVIRIDGWTALGAYIPPKERRGLVLIDPPFEQPDEFARLLHSLEAAHRKWPGGTYLLWYPIKDKAEVSGFIRKLTRLTIPKVLRVELALPSLGTDLDIRLKLQGSGLVVVNPPWTLHAELGLLLPAMARALSPGAAGSFILDWISRESRP